VAQFREKIPVIAGLRANKKTLALWKHKAKAAGLSFNKWAQLMLNNAPSVAPARIDKGPNTHA